jgi:YhcG PDDEXK nuclease domain
MQSARRWAAPTRTQTRIARSRQLKRDDDQPTIGLLLCREKNRLVAEYVLRGLAKPIGVAEYQLIRAVPEPLVSELPSIEQIEAEQRPDGP